MSGPTTTTDRVHLYAGRSGLLCDLTTDRHPSCLYAWRNSELELPENATHFGYVNSDSASIRSSSGQFHLRKGMYFSVVGPCHVQGSGEGFVASRWDYRGFFQVGGPIESRGRLRYIDGCTDSLLVPPVVLGDPCLNMLHVPPGTSQTAHTHPSIRIGTIVAGRGICRTATDEHPLTPGQQFVIPSGVLHSFHTDRSDLTIVAWHPDSDYGPTDQVHPMLNRTELP